MRKLILLVALILINASMYKTQQVSQDLLSNGIISQITHFFQQLLPTQVKEQIYIPSVITNQRLGAIFIGRDDTELASYSSFCNSLIREFESYNVSLWVVSRTNLKNIDSSMDNLRKNNQVTNFIFITHSMESHAGIEVQNYISQNPTQAGALILLSGFLQRTYRPYIVDCLSQVSIKPKHSFQHIFGYLPDGVHDCYGSAFDVQFPVPVLTVGFELDGIVRISRIAQSFYTQNTDVFNKPVVVIQGGNHASIMTIKKQLKNDLASEISSQQVIQSTVKAIRNFVGLQMTNFPIVNLNEFSQLLASSEKFFQPLIAAFVQMENSWWFTGADEEHGSSQWAAEAQQELCSPLPNDSWNWTNFKNEFHMLTDEDKIPPYYRDKHRPDFVVNKTIKQISSVTVAQLRFRKVPIIEAFYGLNGNMIVQEEKMNILNHFSDDGKVEESAIEISVKLASRQLLFNLTGYDSPDSLDDGSRCMAINQKAFDWAFNQAPKNIQDRYLLKGIQMVMKPDQKPSIPAGPFWIWKYLDMHKNQTTNTMDVTSYYAFFSLSANPYGAGNHYCQLLSPARAMEWIYIDSLRTSN